MQQMCFKPKFSKLAFAVVTMMTMAERNGSVPTLPFQRFKRIKENTIDGQYLRGREMYLGLHDDQHLLVCIRSDLSEKVRRRDVEWR